MGCNKDIITKEKQDIVKLFLDIKTRFEITKNSKIDRGTIKKLKKLWTRKNVFKNVTKKKCEES